MRKLAVVVFSGGQDSTTCLFWALAQGFDVHAVNFDYGQRHLSECAAAISVLRIAREYNADITNEVVHLGNGILAGTSPLVSDAELAQYADHSSLPGGLEATFVPMRNQLFLTVAANRAFVRGSNVLVTGVCQEDFGGYPDCRLDFIESLEQTCVEGTFTDRGFQILTPLMHLTKAQSVQLALTLPGCYRALAYSHTAYDGIYPPTGKDHASLLRAKGFEQANVPDPLVLRAWKGGHMELPLTPNYQSEWVSRYCELAGL